MYGYMTDLDTVDNYQTENITAQGMMIGITDIIYYANLA